MVRHYRELAKSIKSTLSYVFRVSLLTYIFFFLLYFVSPCILTSFLIRISKEVIITMNVISVSGSLNYKLKFITMPKRHVAKMYRGMGAKFHALLKWR